MAIELPTLRPAKTANVRPLDFGAWQTPTGPGAAQRLERLGSRFALDIVTGQLRWIEDRRAWIRSLVIGISNTVLYPVPQPGLIIGETGSPKVLYAGQAGSSIWLIGLPIRYVIQAGQFFSIITAGQRYLYVATEDGQVDLNGAVLLPIWPPLRRSPNANDVCEFAAPMIEGALSGNEKGWTDERAHTVGLQLTITETE